MSTLTLKADNVRKSFNGLRDVFEPISLQLVGSDVCAVRGNNGSGKSTLMKMLAGVLQPSSGHVMIESEGHVLDQRARSRITSFVSPYLQLYEEFSAWELLTLDAKLRAVEFNVHYAEELLDTFGLFARRHDEVKNFSSGMKQRTKLVLAAAIQPALLILDEPTTNIDDAGVEVLYDFVRAEQQRKCIIIIATNDARDLDHCNKQISVTPPRTPPQTQNRHTS